MAEKIIGGRPVDISKEDDQIKVVFHPISKHAKYPKAKVFSIKLSRSDLETLKKAL
jgi:hypothetical protein